MVSASDIGQARAPDVELLKEARQRDRFLITRDHDFGRLVAAGEPSAGVLFLRITPSTENAVHEELGHILDVHSRSELEDAFVVVEPGRYRIRRIG